MPSLSSAVRTLVLALLLVLVGWTALAVWADLDAVAAASATLSAGPVLVALALTFLNYALRWAKWHLLLGEDRPGVGTSAGIFLSGFALTVSPGKAGELLKPHLLHTHQGTPWSRTIPVLVAERLTDALALALLALVGVSTFAPDRLPLLLGLVGVALVGAAGLAWAPVRAGVLRLLHALPLPSAVVGPLEAALTRFGAVMNPTVFALSTGLSLPAWFAEATGFWWILHDVELPVSLELATFVYSFATVLGAPSPGGLGATDLALAEGIHQLSPGADLPTAVVAALVTRLATLWIGVAIGLVIWATSGLWLVRGTEQDAR